MRDHPLSSFSGISKTYLFIVNQPCCSIPKAYIFLNPETSTSQDGTRNDRGPATDGKKGVSGGPLQQLSDSTKRQANFWHFSSDQVSGQKRKGKRVILCDLL